MVRARTMLKNERLPKMFRPILWGLRWDALRAWKDREAVIMAALNEGNLKHLRWIKKTYGADEIRNVLSRRLETELHLESRNLARVLFSIQHFRHAR